MKERLIKVLALTIPMIAVYAGVKAFAAATMYELYNAISVGGSGIGGVQGKISITSPKISTTDFRGHRDYMVYVYLQEGTTGKVGTIGAGWIAWKNSNDIVRKASLVYVNDQRYTASVHNITLSVSSLSTIDAVVTQDSSSGNCWTASTYGQVYSWCFESELNKGTAAASIGGSRESYKANESDMPGLFDQLKAYDKNDTRNPWKYFSMFSNYKCNTTGSYVLDKLAKYSNAPGNNQIDKVGTGPSLYYTNDCTYSSSVWSPYHRPGEP
jgi:hypothetical protein